MSTLQRFLATAFLSMALSPRGGATSIVLTPLGTQVKQAAVIVVGRVDDVTMHSQSGVEIKDPKARTGPGSPYELRLHVTLDPKRVLKGQIAPGVKTVVLPLWKDWINDLAGARGGYGKMEWIFFLTPDLRPQNEAEFDHFITELSDILREIQRSQKPNHSPEPTPSAAH